MDNRLFESQLFLDIVGIVSGCLITAFSVSCILVPNGLSTSGITGLALVAQKFTGINYTYVYYAFSISILIAAYLLMGKRTVFKIISVSLLYPAMLVVMNRADFVFVKGDMFLVCVYFSIFYGVGGGLVLRRGFTFGGTDTIARILNKKVFKNVSISQIMLVLDALVIILLGFVFGKEVALYALVNHVMCIFVMDYMLFGFRAKLYKVSIISANYREISEFIFKELKRGVTIHDVVGAYTNEPRKMITCICAPSQSAIIRRFLAENYPDVFMEVSPIITVYAIGNRFVRLKEEDL
ncbi:MAG: YitT family protein [Peptostreptococcaceae bacterium]|nr:YitT family protein [Peptostreptococcaceae bacterium]